MKTALRLLLQWFLRGFCVVGFCVGVGFLFYAGITYCPKVMAGLGIACLLVIIGMACDD